MRTGDSKEPVMKLTPQMIKKNGRNEFVVLSYGEYEALRRRLADADDLLELRKAKRLDDPSAPGLNLNQLKSALGLKPAPARRRRSRTPRPRN
jgi:hypothetical protein